jgi:hypothetical protein
VFWDFLSQALKSEPVLATVKDAGVTTTPIGHGRLFLWVCLRNQSLAEMVQKAVLDAKSLKSFYEPFAVLRQPELTDGLIEALYDPHPNGHFHHCCNLHHTRHTRDHTITIVTATTAAI